MFASLTMMVLCSVSAASARAYIGSLADGDERVYSRWFMGALLAAIASAVPATLAATLLFACHKRSTVALRAWVRIMCALYLAAILYVVGSLIAFGAHGSGSDIFVAFLEGALFFGILAYCILCVNSYYLVLKCNQDMEGPPKTEY
ncbi:unnamed protein product [Parnassius apollo]|uniref:(apollo) hypothetical protein n=1 Tax=Parnassius apollo TaxID=110799 RepID=A0A8S3XG53_PARAO|nr:unnamed protein product [Parnassius apollo]